MTSGHCAADVAGVRAQLPAEIPLGAWWLVNLCTWALWLALFAAKTVFAAVALCWLVSSSSVCKLGLWFPLLGSSRVLGPWLCTQLGVNFAAPAASASFSQNAPLRWHLLALVLWVAG